MDMKREAIRMWGLLWGMLFLVGLASAEPLQSYWPVLALTVYWLIGAARETFRTPRTRWVKLTRLAAALGILVMVLAFFLPVKLPEVEDTLQFFLTGLLTLEMLLLALLGLSPSALQAVAAITCVHMILLCCTSHHGIVPYLAGFFILQVLFRLQAESSAFPEKAARWGRLLPSARSNSELWMGRDAQEAAASFPVALPLTLAAWGFALFLFVFLPRTPLSFDFLRTKEREKGDQWNFPVQGSWPSNGASSSPGEKRPLFPANDPSFFLSIIGSSREDDTLVMKVRCTTKEGIPYESRGSLPLRGLTMEKYENGKWSSARTIRFLRDEEDGRRDGWIQMPLSLPPSSLPVHQEFQIEFMVRRTLFALPEVEAVGLEALGAGEDGSLYFPVWLREPLHFKAISRELRLSPEELSGLPWPKGVPEYIALPRPFPEVERLARSRVKDGASYYETCSAIAVFLKNNFQYSPILTKMEGRSDPVEEFLFEKKAGNCVHFATAMIVMLRILGIPSRLACGFAPDPPAEERGVYVVRMRDAHAWVEVYAEGVGWLPFDPSGFSPLPAVPEEESNSLAKLWERWGPPALFKFLSRYEETDRGTILRYFFGFFKVGVVVLILAAGILAIFLYTRPRSVKRLFRRKREPARAKGFYGKFLDILLEHGIRRHPSQTPWELAKQASLLLPAKALERITEVHCAIRYGRGKLDAQTAGEIRRVLEMLLRFKKANEPVEGRG